MLILAAVVAVVLVVVIALVAVGGVVARLRTEPPRQVFEHDEALEFVAQALPDSTTAQLGYEDVQRILRFHLDYLYSKGVARSGGDLQLGPGVRVVDPQEAQAYVLRRAALVDFYPNRTHVVEVIASQLAYFEAIGAVSEVEGPDLEELEAEQHQHDRAEPQPPPVDGNGGPA
ncbi:MAG: hypothetical protein GEV08_07000 [Acidimicrobiia bacterium]|nr:hypothetical protein [Acidimicrobiia bacterium]